MLTYSQREKNSLYLDDFLTRFRHSNQRQSGTDMSHSFLLLLLLLSKNLLVKNLFIEDHKKVMPLLDFLLLCDLFDDIAFLSDYY